MGKSESLNALGKFDVIKYRQKRKSCKFVLHQCNWWKCAFRWMEGWNNNTDLSITSKFTLLYYNIYSWVGTWNKVGHKVW